MAEVETLFAYFYTDQGRTKLAIALGDDDRFEPLMATNAERLSEIKSVARSLANSSGKQLDLVQFDRAKTLETVVPDQQIN